MKAHWKAFIAALAIPLAAGGFSAWLSGDMGSFDTLQKPPLSPPGWLFPAAWTLPVSYTHLDVYKRQISYCV